ncbi:hypothetical protein ASE63_20400 [Bosea sp. Root381]|uniref:hypothetical protein n=1 Tax=Bosea sp. Root381 TaxID=1736524 RepID=UPI0006F4F209|nr:hypothetical protein [Bosea sp. Root381]KRE11319.1 hypothetical protein ASE63_20400 [Bosea sp. Root381]
MAGGLGGFIASEISGAVRRNVTVYVLMGFAALLMFCAAGYALNALHSHLALQHGTVAASLYIAGGLLLVALVALGIALYLKNRRRPGPPVAATAMMAAPLLAPLAAKLAGSRKGWRVALIGGVVVLGAVLGRQFFNNDDTGEGDA